jgi:hypothetical protein
MAKPFLPRLPHRRFTARVMLRTAFFWAGGRVLLAMAMVLAMLGPGPSPGTSSLGIILVVAVMALADARRRGETLLLANLGVAPRETGLVAGATAALLEGVLAVAWW